MKSLVTSINIYIYIYFICIKYVSLPCFCVLSMTGAFFLWTPHRWTLKFCLPGNPRNLRTFNPQNSLLSGGIIGSHQAFIVLVPCWWRSLNTMHQSCYESCRLLWRFGWIDMDETERGGIAMRKMLHLV